MSGICGIVHFDGRSVKKKEIQNMLDAIQNCGNDCEEMWIDENVGFGHKMLWTTSESLLEKQPLIGEDGKFVLVADARIDNRKELLEKLNIKDLDVEAITDADLIMHSFLTWGEHCGRYLIGDFAFVIWDKNKKSFLFMRDHMGIKPLYYFIDDKIFAYASEISALFTIDGISKSIDKEAIDQYRELTALSCDKTFFRNILRVKPAHLLMLEKEQLRHKRYWYPEKISSNHAMTFEEAKTGFKQVLSQAILSRMRRVSGPIGCELSGGLDSSSVVVLANELTTNQIFTFSTTFEGLECDEKHFIDLVLDKTGIKGFFTKFNQDDYRNKYSFIRYYRYSLDWVGRGMFSFFFDIMDKAKEQNVKVVLTGFGSDEIFPDRAFMLSDLLKRFHFRALYNELKNHPTPIRHLFAYGIFPLLPIKIIKFFEFIFPNTLFVRIIRVRSEFKYVCYSFKTEKNKSFAEVFNLKSIISNSVDELNTLAIYRFSGKFGLEFRHPFLDKRVIEYILSVPSYYKFSNNKKKNLLKETLKELLPRDLYLNTKETDFSELFVYNIDTYREISQKKIGTNLTIYESWVKYEQEYWENINKKEI